MSFVEKFLIISFLASFNEIFITCFQLSVDIAFGDLFENLDFSIAFRIFFTRSGSYSEHS